jgi:hypothetical protein
MERKARLLAGWLLPVQISSLPFPSPTNIRFTFGKRKEEGRKGSATVEGVDIVDGPKGRGGQSIAVFG